MQPTKLPQDVFFTGPLLKSFKYWFSFARLGVSRTIHVNADSLKGSTQKKYGIIWEFFPTWGGVYPILKAP